MFAVYNFFYTFIWKASRWSFGLARIRGEFVVVGILFLSPPPDVSEKRAGGGMCDS